MAEIEKDLLEFIGRSSRPASEEAIEKLSEDGERPKNDHQTVAGSQEENEKAEKSELSDGEKFGESPEGQASGSGRRDSRGDAQGKGSAEENEEELEEGEMGSADVELPEHLVYDEEDRMKLLAMSELQRELVFAERGEKQDKEKERQDYLSHPAKQDDDVRFTSRRDNKDKGRKDSALRKLQAAMERKQSAKEEGMSDEEVVVEQGGDRDVRVGDAASDDNAQDIISESESDNERSHRRIHDLYGGRRDRRGRMDEYEDDDLADMKDVQGIQIVRTQLERWVNEPHFENTLPRCFVRMAESDGMNQRAYRIMEIREVKTQDSTYKFGPRNVFTNKYLVLREGYKEYVREMVMVSNSFFMEEEFNRWQHCCDRDERPPLTKQDIDEARERIDKAEKYTYTAEDVKKLLEAKRAKGKTPVNVTAERMKLKRMIDYYKQQQDFGEVEKLNQQLSALEAKSVPQKSSKKDGMASINKRNMMLNFKNALKNVSHRPENEKVFDDGADPFQRRATRPNIYWKTGKAKEDEIEAKKRARSEDAPCERNTRLRLSKYVDVVERIDSEIFDLRKLRSPHPSELVVRDLLPDNIGFSDEQTRLEADVDEGNKRSLTLYDYRCRQGLIN